MADGKLIFLRPASGSGRLVLGDSHAGSIVPDAEVWIDAGVAGECAASLDLHMGVFASIDAGIAGEGAADVQLDWDANAFRHAAAFCRQHQQQAQGAASLARPHWQRSQPLRAVHRPAWQDGAPALHLARAYWQRTEALRPIARSNWQQGLPTAAATRSHLQQTIVLRAVGRSAWQQARPVLPAWQLGFQQVVALRAGARSHMQVGQPVLHVARGWLRTGQPLARPWRAAFELARYPLPGITPSAPPPEPPPPPCYDPARRGLLVFDAPATADGRLVFVCRRAGPDPVKPQYVIPLLRVYMTVHAVSAVLLPSLERVRLDNVSISSDDDGFAWQLSASGPEHLLDQLAPVAGMPPRVRITIDDSDWVFVIEPPERARRFAGNKVQVRGTSVTGLLGSLPLPVQSWSNAAPITAQQIVLEALQYTDVTVNWGISDWLIPVGAWAHQGSPLSAAQRVAEAAGAVLRSHRTDAALQIAPKYPHMPWEWPTAVPDVQMPGHIITTDTLQHVAAAHYDSVYVSGSTAGGVLAQVVRSGLPGDKPAPQIVDPLITDALAARQRGRAVLASAAITRRQPITVPLLTGGTNPGLILPGYLIEVVEPSETWRGLVRGITITAGVPTVRQALSVERAI